MKATIYLIRDQYGVVTWAGTHKPEAPDPLTAYPVKSRQVSTTKQLAYAMLQSGTRRPLFDAAWRKAVQCGAVDPSHTFQYGEAFDCQTIEYARQEAFQVEGFISELVNNPNSKFYIHG